MPRGQIHTHNPLYVPGPVCDEAGLSDGDGLRRLITGASGAGKAHGSGQFAHLWT